MPVGDVDGFRAVKDEKEAPQGHKGVGGVSIGAWH